MFFTKQKRELKHIYDHSKDRTVYFRIVPSLDVIGKLAFYSYNSAEVIEINYFNIKDIERIVAYLENLHAKVINENIKQVSPYKETLEEEEEEEEIDSTLFLVIWEDFEDFHDYPFEELDMTKEEIEGLFAPNVEDIIVKTKTGKTKYKQGEYTAITFETKNVIENILL